MQCELSHRTNNHIHREEIMLNRMRIPSLILAGSAAVALAAPATAQTSAEAAVTTDAEASAEATDGEWLSLSGSVVSVAPDSFMLDYGSKTIAVEMDDYDWFDENAVVVGDEVVVTGRMDSDFWENRKIEASSVYVDSRGTMYFASAADEEGFVYPVLAFDPLTNGESVSLTGEVTGVVGDEIALDAGLMEYRVDVGELDYDPLDSDGVQRISEGDRIYVFGSMDSSDLFDAREIDAHSITEIG
jgi:uncharacterized protein YdeI (BOF family)